ncbi:bifunctional DNA-formamidopyrimidine glycosylase/DNA-(apurinic or apyrimidinic site) lyase [Deinococcus roseus]|uniref:Formamidopyrimidine-DNA glycosylase n=1 Tax=Deinococcus roseus TaxID=392414 RepID=A0ABQ2CU96_9DEIO|nr:bifunctional DNA-formamidopyrimidine glycosylase/DNA-(apurinic or apyrimidinic site) lyase [Deinococcus roseus]GGJ17936.1 formamidopyrimidine-DNA glycosylase [Deinococcus roseus]
MPELPEVETTRKLIEPFVLGQVIEAIDHEKNHRYTDLANVVGKRITELTRRGKYIIAHFEEPLEMIVHLGMTGGFRLQEGKHTRVTLKTAKGTVYFQDARKFGKWQVVPKGEYAALPTLHEMGPEPLSDDFKLEDFVKEMRHAGKVKPHLMSQKPVAGLGNIYADEALWHAQIHPEAVNLSEEQSTRLYHAIRQVIARAVEAGGSTLSDQTYAQLDGNPGYFQLDHVAYARDGKPCKRCGTPLEKYWLAQRGTHYCPTCQKL